MKKCLEIKKDRETRNSNIQCYLENTLKRIGIKDQVALIEDKDPVKKKRPKTARHVHPGSSIKTYQNQRLDENFNTNEILNENTNTAMPTMT